MKPNNRLLLKQLYDVLRNFPSPGMQVDAAFVDLGGLTGTADKLLRALYDEAKMLPASSSNVRSYGYLPECWLLFIQFDGGVYAYEVPQRVYDELAGAESKGKCFAANIKGKFDHVKLTETVDASTSTRA